MKTMIALILLAGLVGCGKKNDCCCSSAPVTIVEKAKDPVCGMWVEKNRPNYQDRIVVFDNTKYYFCADECAADFSKNQTKYVTKCACPSYKHDCKCDHCSGKQVPCDCR